MLQRLLQKLPVREQQRRLAVKMGLAFVVRILGGVALFITYAVITHLLGVEESGEYFLAFAIVTVLAIVARCGLDGPVVRFVSAYASVNEWVSVNGVVKRAVIWAAIYSFSIALLLMMLSDVVAHYVFNKPKLHDTLQYSAISIPFIAISFLMAQALMGLHDTTTSIFVQNIGVPLLMTFFLLIAYFFQLPLEANTAAISLMLASCAVMIFAWLWWFRHPQLSWGGDFSSERLRHTAGPLYVVALMTLLVSWGGQLCAARWLSSIEYAQLSVAYRISQLISIVLPVVNLVVAPRFAAFYHAGDIRGLTSIALFAVRISTVTALPIIIFICAFPGWVLSFFGDGFDGAITALIILMCAQFLNVATGSTGNLLAMTGHERDLRNVTIISGPVTIILTLVLTPRYGLIGAATATAIGIAGQNLAACWMVKRRLGFNTLAMWRKFRELSESERNQK